MTYQNEQQVLFKQIKNGDIEFRTNSNAIFPLFVLPISILLVMFALFLYSEGVDTSTFYIVGGLAVIAFIVSLFMPIQDQYTINLKDGTLAYTRIFFTSQYGYPPEKTEYFKILKNGVSFGESKFRNRGILIKTDESNLLLMVQYPSYDQGEIQLEVEKYFGLAVEADPHVDALSLPGVGESMAMPAEAAPDDTTDPALYVINSKMLEQIRSWGVSSLLLGALHFGVSRYLSPSWGVILVIVGLLSFSFKSSSMFIVYAVALLWVGVNNIIVSGIGAWSLFGLYQIFLAYRLYRKYRIFHENEQMLLEADGKDEQYQNSEKWFPKLSLIFGGGSFVLYLAFWISIIGLAVLQFSIAPYYGALDVIAEILSGLGMVGFSISLAILISKYEKKWKAWIGLICSVLLIVIHFLVIYL